MSLTEHKKEAVTDLRVSIWGLNFLPSVEFKTSFNESGLYCSETQAKRQLSDGCHVVLVQAISISPFLLLWAIHCCLEGILSWLLRTEA
jgi:hypothetical protein